MWDGRQEPQASGTSSEAPGHIGGGPCLVEKDQLLGIERRLAPDEQPTRLGDIRPVLLSGVQTFF
jgi:hypothetical protein